MIRGEYGIYDHSSGARLEAISVDSWRQKFICERCGNPTGHCKIPKGLLVIKKKAWDRICSKFRKEKEIRQNYNYNILLCPKCMEELNGGVFKSSEVIWSLVGNKWYKRKED